MKDIIDNLLRKIHATRAELFATLIQFECSQYAQDEIYRSIDCLENLDRESFGIFDQDRIVSTFLPINQPLYGLILFGIVPQLYAKRVYVRPPTISYKIVTQVSNILCLSAIAPQLSIENMTRVEFVDKYIPFSDVVIFIGKYENALSVRRRIRRDALFIFSGYGVNPFIILDDADIDVSLQKSLEARLYNSGQDCAAPDVFFVSEKISKQFCEMLKSNLDAISVGSNWKTSVIGPLIRSESVTDSFSFLSKHRKRIIYGGAVDVFQNLVYPSIIYQNIDEGLIFAENFAPIFVVIAFDNLDQLKRYFNDPRYYEYAMYVSVFSKKMYELAIKNSIVLHNKSVLDVEQGNSEFGGYGQKSNFVFSHNYIASRPILIQREISDFYNGKLR